MRKNKKEHKKEVKKTENNCLSGSNLKNNLVNNKTNLDAREWFKQVNGGNADRGNGNKDDADESFSDAFKFYELFWKINGYLGDTKENNKIEDSDKKPSKISQLVKKMLDCCRE